MLLEILVAAAASARPALTAALPDMERAAGETVVLRFGATGSFARQIENGAPFDLFFAADEETPRALATRGLLEPDSLRLYLEGRLVLVASRESGLKPPANVDAAYLRRLPSLVPGKVAIASPKVAPYGRAAEQALAKAGAREALGARLVLAGNVEEALAYVASGNADVGLVAGSLAEGSGLPMARVDPALHAPVRQLGGVVAASGKRDAARRALEAAVARAPRAP